MLNVRVKRAVLKPRVSLPMIGIRSCRRWNCRRASGLRSQRANRTAAITAAISSHNPYARKKSLVPIRTRVMSGSFALFDSNTATTFGTTNTSRPETMAKHITVSTIG